MSVRPLSTVDGTRGYARVSHSRQWSTITYTGNGAVNNGEITS